MKRHCLFAYAGFLGLALAGLSCDDDRPTKCVYKDAKQLTENAATKIPAATLISTGKDFVIAGIEGTPPAISWTQVTASGVAGAAFSFTLTETPVIVPQLAVTSRTAPGDQLVVVYGIMNAQMQIELRAVTQFAGEPAAAPISLKVLPAGLALTDVRLAVGSSRTGLRALVAWGLGDQPGTKIETMVLGANGALVGTPLQFEAPDSWKCLQFVPSRTDWGLSWVRTTTAGKPSFVVEEGRDSNSALVRYNVPLATEEVSCPVVAPSDRGYLIAWQTVTGTWVSDYNMATGTVSPEFVAGAVRFGDPASQPPVAGVTALGLDATVTFGVKTGPQVWLFDAFGTLVGEPLKLPAGKGAAGPVSTWPLAGAFYATYREGTAAAPTEGPRWFMKVECPSN